jgi:hypothetical protein
MIFRFAHEGRVYDFDDEIMSLDEAMWMEEQTGLTGVGWIEAFHKLSVKATLAVFCLALKRGGIVIEKLSDAPLDPKNGYIQLINSIQNDELPEPEPARQPTRAVRKRAAVKR